jgi:hypothetical protein
MKRRCAFFAIILLALMAPSCRGSQDDEAAIRERLAKVKTADLMAEVAKAEYTPPADGRLTAEQVRMYLQVKEREAKIREVAVAHEGDGGTGASPLADQPAGPGGDPGAQDDFVTADLRACQELGVNPKEYAWVEERVQEARMAQASRSLEGQLGEQRARYLAMLEAEKAAADDAHKAEIEQQIEAFKQDAAAAAPHLSSAVQFNLALLSGYQEKIEQVEAVEARAAATRLQSEGRGAVAE